MTSQSWDCLGSFGVQKKTTVLLSQVLGSRAGGWGHGEGVEPLSGTKENTSRDTWAREHSQGLEKAPGKLSRVCKLNANHVKSAESSSSLNTGISKSSQKNGIKRYSFWWIKIKMSARFFILCIFHEISEDPLMDFKWFYTKRNSCFNYIFPTN